MRKGKCGLINDPKRGFMLYLIDSVSGDTAKCRLLYDEGRYDPTLMTDLLAENIRADDPHFVAVDQFIHHFDDKIEALDQIKAWNERHGWHREHLKSCRREAHEAKRRAHVAEEALKWSILNGFNR